MCGAEKIAVPDAEQSHQHGQVLRKRGGAEVLVHLMEAIEHGLEILRPDRQHRRKADGRVHRIAPANPVPEAEHVIGIDAELRYLGCVCRYRDKVPGDGLFVAAQGLEQPRARRVGIGHGFERREGFRGNDEQSLGRIETLHSFREIGAVDVGNEPERHGAIAVVFQRLVRHYRTEVGAADADVDHVANALAGVPLPLAAANAIGEGGHLVEHRVHLRNHILAVDDDGGSFGRAQGHVQDGALLGGVDLLASKHGVDARPQAGFFGQIEEKLDSFSVMRFFE